MLRSFGVISDQRPATRPDLPTSKQQGLDVPPFEFRSGWAAPAGTPASVAEKLHGERVAVLQSAGTEARRSNLGTVIDTSEKPADFANMIASDLPWMNTAAKANDIKQS